MPKFLEVNRSFPYVHLRKDVYAAKDVNPQLKQLTWVILPDGRPGVVDHVKPDGTLGVKPVNPLTGEFFPNPTEHWSMEDRWRIPEEIAIAPSQIRNAEKSEIPRFVHAD